MVSINFWVLSLILISVVSLFLGLRIYSLTERFRNSYFAALLACVSGWSVLYALEIAAVTIEQKILFASLEYLFIVFIAPLWLFTTLIISERAYTPPISYFRLSLVLPIITVSLALSNDVHHLIWTSFKLIETPSATFLEVEHGPLFWVYASYAYLLIGFGSFRMLKSVAGASKVFWLSRTAMILGGLVPIVFNGIYIFNIGPVSYVDLSPFAFSFSTIAYVYVYFKRNVANLQPITRSKMLDLIPMGVAVITEDGVVLDANESFLNMIASNEAVGQKIVTLLPEIEALTDTEQSSLEYSRDQRSFRLRNQQVENGGISCVILLLEDITSQQHTELALEDSNAKIHEILEFMPVAVFEIDPDGVFVDANRTGLEMTGYSEFDFGEKNVLEILVPQDSARASEYLEKWVGGELFTAEYNVIRKDGSEFPVIAQSVPLRKDGELVGFRGYTLDLTDQKKAQAKLAETEELYRRLVEISPFGIVVSTFNRITFANETMKEIFAAPNTDTLLAFQPQHFILQSGNDIEELSLLDILHLPNDRGSLLALDFQDRPFNMEFRRSEILSAEGKAYLLLFENVSEQVRNLQTLQEIQQRYQALFSSARDIICITDLEGKILEVNDTCVEMISFPRADLIGRSLIEFIAPEDVAKVVKLDQKLKSDPSFSVNYPTKFRLMDRAGTAIVADVAITRIHRQGGPANLQFVARDITFEHDTRKGLQAEKEIAELIASTKTELLSTMSHEIRTPLNTIIGTAQLLARESMPVDQAEKTERILKASDFLLGIINGVLDLSKLEAGKIELHNSTFETRRLFSEIYHMFDAVAEQKRLAYELHIDAAVPPFLIGDTTRIKQICSNLIGNAIKFTDEGSVELSLEFEGNSTILVAVSDTGIGLNPTKSATIFQKYSQEDRSIEARFGGTGLGLAICEQLIDLMGGSISVESQPKVGSHFKVRLELAEGRSEDADVTSIIEELDLRGKSILVAEDNEMNQLLISEILSGYGCEYVCVSDGQEAVAANRSDSFDLILMDIQMPNMNGYEATNAIRNARANSAVQIVALTANDSEEQRQRCKAAGMDDFVSKPIDIAELTATLARLMLPEI